MDGSLTDTPLTSLPSSSFISARTRLACTIIIEVCPVRQTPHDLTKGSVGIMRDSSIALNAIVLALLAHLSAASLAPPVLPLIVRNPYLSTWLPNARETPWQKWPMFWFGQDVTMLRLGERSIGLNAA